MICFTSSTPPIQQGDFLITHYDHTWLIEILEHAASQAQSPIPSQDIAMAIEHHLQNSPMQALTLPQIGQKITHSLRALGHHQIADHIQVIPPQVPIDLAVLAQVSPGSLFLNTAIEQEISYLAQQGITRFQLIHQLDCAQTLSPTKRWSSTTQTILHELRATVEHFSQEK